MDVFIVVPVICFGYQVCSFVHFFNFSINFYYYLTLSNFLIFTSAKAVQLFQLVILCLWAEVLKKLYVNFHDIFRVALATRNNN